jgi:hypothetical protein
MKPDRWHRSMIEPGGTRWVSDEIDVHYSRLCMALGFEATVATGSYIALGQVWYKDYPKEKFHFFNDDAEWMGMDKIGHIVTSYTLGRYGVQSLIWCGVKEKKAVWLGALTGFVYQTGLEIFDGYSSGWGFSVGDMLANAGGYFLLTGQYLIGNRYYFAPKFSFYPSGYAQYRPSLLGENTGQQILKDYNAQIYWLSANISSFLDRDSNFPAWLNIAVGYGANGMTGGKNNPPYYNNATGNYETFSRYRQFYISPDINLAALNFRSEWLRRTARLLNFIKVPLPGLMIAQGKLSAQWISH